MTLPMSNAPLIYKKICDLMKDVESIGKNRANKAQSYSFRGVDDCYNYLHAKFAEHRIFTVPEVIEQTREQKTSSSGSVLLYSILKIKFHFFAEDGSSITATMIGEGMDSGDKASNKAQSVAHKYALLQVFMIPTEDEKDPENDSHDLKPSTSEDPKQPPKKPQSSAPLNAPKSDLATPAQIKRLFAIANAHGWGDASVKSLAVEKFKVKSRNELKWHQVNDLIKIIEDVK